ncbi:MAG TPA: redoxin family protein [Bryobacteraceae bacterium]|nr:redoxin family protein [Bryobacteraceae bacterium]
MRRLHKRWTALGLAFGFLIGPATILGQQPQSDAQRRAEHAAQVAAEEKAHPTLAIGSQAPDFNLPGVDGRKHKLSEYKNFPFLAILFTCNHCPTAQLYEGRVKSLVEEYRPKGVGFVAIQPNAPAAASARELNYTDVDDTLDGMMIRAKHRHFDFPYLYDGDTQSTAEAYGPKATPHIFIFDKDRKLQFEGRIDNNQRESLVKTQDTRAALDDMIAGKPVAVPKTAVFGCATKWKDQVEMKQRETKLFQSQPVDLEMATPEVLQKLRSNPTGKTLMINFWATWCGPCVEEFHDLLDTYLWYRSRDFELVTVSTNTPDEKADVLKFLKDEHSGVRNLLFSSDDTYALQAAFDSKWDSGVPFTIVIAPDGKVIYREAGEVHLLKLRRAILATLPEKGYIGNNAYWASDN